MESEVYIVDDDEVVGETIMRLLSSFGIKARWHGSAMELLDCLPLPAGSCVLSDVRMPGMGGLSLLQTLQRRGEKAPVMLITAYADLDVAVAAFRNGADDFLRKPYSNSELVEVVQRALERARDVANAEADRRSAETMLESLSGRELEVARLLADGLSNKEVGRQLGISHRTVEHHRKSALEKTGCRSLVNLGTLLMKVDA